MKILFSSAWQRTASLFTFLCLTNFLIAQTTCSVTGPSMACVGDMSTFYVNVTSTVPNNVVWKLVPAGSGTLVMADNNMTMVHWLTSGTVQVIAEIKSTDPNPALLSTCSVNPAVEVMTFPNPKIVPAYAPDIKNCVKDARSEVFFYCAGSTVTFFPNGSGGDYEWTVTGNVVSSQVDPATHYLTIHMDNAGSVKITLKETNAAGCSRQASVDCSIIEPPTSSFKEISHGTQNPIQVCKGEDLLFFGSYSDPLDLACRRVVLDGYPSR